MEFKHLNVREIIFGLKISDHTLEAIRVTWLPLDAFLSIEARSQHQQFDAVFHSL